MSNLEEEPYSGIFASLKHPVRRKILRMLQEKPRSFSEILESLGVSSSYLTYHLENLGQLASKTDDGKYRLSSFGEAAVTTMIRVEEIPKTKERKLFLLPLKWKYIFAAFMIGLVILACVNYVEYQSLNRISGEHEPIKELVELAGNESLDTRLVKSWFLSNLQLIRACCVIYSPYDDSMLNLVLSTTWYESPSSIPITVQQGNIFASSSNETPLIIWSANATSSNSFLVPLAQKGWYTISLVGPLKPQTGTISTSINETALSPNKVFCLMRALIIYQAKYSVFAVTVPPEISQLQLIGSEPHRLIPSNATEPPPPRIIYLVCS